MITKPKTLAMSCLAGTILLFVLMEWHGQNLSADGGQPVLTKNEDPGEADATQPSAGKGEPADDGAVPEATPASKKSAQPASPSGSSKKVFRNESRKSSDGTPAGGLESGAEGRPAGGAAMPPGMMGGKKSRKVGMPGMGGGMPGMGGMPGLMAPGAERGSSPGGGYLPNAGIVPKNYVQGKNVGLMQNEERDKLWGYSLPLGKWTGLSIPKTDERLIPTLSSDVGAFKTDDRIYAFSSKTGRWAVLNTKGVFIVYPEQIIVDDQGTIHIFSNVTGRWSSTDDSHDQDVTTGGADSMPGATSPPLLVDDRGRRIVLGTIDRDGDLDVLVPETSERVSAADLLESLKARLSDSEHAVAQTTIEYRTVRERSGDKALQAIELKSRLATAVAETFDRRQQAQRLEAEILRVKLQRVDARLLEREKSKTRIISRRVDELIDSSGAEHSNLDVQPTESTKPRRSNNQGGSSTESEVFPKYVPRGHASRTVGVVSSVSSDGRIVLSPQEPSGIHIGDELEVSRPDFVHEDGTQQYYSFARLFVVEAHPDSAVARVVEISRTMLDNKYVNEKIAAGNTVGISIEAPEKRPEAANPLLVPLQGRWRCQRWVEDGRVYPPGDLKGSRHVLFIDGDRFTIVDLSAGRILGKTKIGLFQPQGPRTTLQFYMENRISLTPRVPGGRGFPGESQGACEVTDQTLRICVIPKGYRGDPSDFEEGPDRILWEFTRDNATPPFLTE